MSAPIHPNPENATQDELRAVQKATADFEMGQRIMAIILLLNGISRDLVIKSIGCHPNSLRNWVVAFNQSGIDGLATQPHPGRPPILHKGQRLVLSELFDRPQDLAEEFWTKRKFYGMLKRELQVKLGYSTLARYLREEGFRLLVPRPTAPDRDPKARAEFVEWLQLQLDQHPEQIWFCDESGFMADPRPKAMYAKKGTTPTCPATGLHIRENVIGAVQPTTGEFISLVFNWVDLNVFQCFLDYLAEQTAGRQVHLILDNASWHRSAKLNWHHIQKHFLPAYSPDLNPIERLWMWIKNNHFTNWYSKSREALQDRLAMALNDVMDAPTIVQSVCRA
jgi:transposase